MSGVCGTCGRRKRASGLLGVLRCDYCESQKAEAQRERQRLEDRKAQGDKELRRLVDHDAAVRRQRLADEEAVLAKRRRADCDRLIHEVAVAFADGGDRAAPKLEMFLASPFYSDERSYCDDAFDRYPGLGQFVAAAQARAIARLPDDLAADRLDAVWVAVQATWDDANDDSNVVFPRFVEPRRYAAIIDELVRQDPARAEFVENHRARWRSAYDDARGAVRRDDAPPDAPEAAPAPTVAEPKTRTRNTVFGALLLLAAVVGLTYRLYLFFNPEREHPKIEIPQVPALSQPR